MKILSLTYLGNIEWLCNLLFEDCVIDLYEHYHKQSYRNRCQIMTASGVAALSVQVARPDNVLKAPMREVRIDYSKRWQHQHWNSIVSAYRNAPYFDHYAGRFEPFYMRRFDFLADLNMGLLEVLLDALGTDVRPRFSEEHIEASAQTEDLRLTPKAHPTPPAPSFIPDPHFTPQEYYQTFSDRLPFAPNLSAIDLLFCEGPGAMEVLRGSYGCAPANTHL